MIHPSTWHFSKDLFFIPCFWGNGGDVFTGCLTHTSPDYGTSCPHFCQLLHTDIALLPATPVTVFPPIIHQSTGWCPCTWVPDKYYFDLCMYFNSVVLLRTTVRFSYSDRNVSVWFSYPFFSLHFRVRFSNPVFATGLIFLCHFDSSCLPIEYLALPVCQRFRYYISPLPASCILVCDTHWFASVFVAYSALRTAHSLFLW